MSKKKETTRAEEPVQELSEVKEEAQAVEKPVPVKAVKKPDEPVVYLGPTIEHVVVHGTVFTDGLPAALKAKIAEKPILGSLIYPVSQYAKIALAITTKGTAEYTLYHKAL